MSDKVRKDGIYSGLREDGKPWPEMLIGVKEIAGYLRKHPRTIERWIAKGLLIAPKDTKGRRWTTKSLIDRWIIEIYKAELEIRRAKEKVEGRGAREQRKGLRCGAEAWEACPVNPEARHSMECYPTCPYCLASDGHSHTEHCPAVHGTWAS